MKVFKFGGASVKDADGVRNVAKVLENFKDEELMLVVSAMGKTTNALEQVVNAFYNQTEDLTHSLTYVYDFHMKIIEKLFKEPTHPIYNEVAILCNKLNIMTDHKPTKDYDFIYDQLVSVGELLSTKIVAAYLNEVGIETEWLDARRLVKTDSTYRDAQVNWTETVRRIKKAYKPNVLQITQGFIGSDEDSEPTTLGREGSDYSAAILAYALNADEVVIWKDVPGVLNGDPRHFSDTKLLPEISYYEAIELAYYGASVIHPKTIQPLQRKKITLSVKSFLDINKPGTKVFEAADMTLIPPCFILKPNQVLITIAAKDFSFIVEDNLSEIFGLFSDMGIKVNLTQNSAISTSFCVDNAPMRLPKLITELQKKYNVKYNDEGLSLYTIRHYTPETEEQVLEGKKLFLEQKSRHTVQLVLK